MMYSMLVTNMKLMITVLYHYTLDPVVTTMYTTCLVVQIIQGAG